MPTTDFDEVRSKRKLVPNFLTVPFRQNKGETLADSVFYIATRSVKVIAVRESHEAAGTDAGAVNIQVEKLASGQAPGAGTNVLTAVIDLKATTNTPQTGSVVGTAATVTLSAGQRLGINLTGTPTAVAGLVVEVDLEVMAVA